MDTQLEIQKANLKAALDFGYINFEQYFELVRFLAEKEVKNEN